MPTLEQLDAAMSRPWLQVPAVQQLGGGHLSLTDRGRPARVVGADAAVYQLRQSNGKVLALRCPLSDTFTEMYGVHYRALTVGGGLERLRLEPGWLAGNLRYVGEGLMIPRREFRSSGHPVIAMEWIEGLTLLDTVQEACSIGHHQSLATLAQEWLSLVAGIGEAGFTHGDLSAENAIVRRDGRITLVDYDTCAWPDSVPASTPVGTPGFVHPRASERTPAASKDAFAALIVYVSLQALAVHPGIWERARAQPARTGQELLFSTRQLADLQSSPVFAELLRLEDRPIQPLLSALSAVCAGAPDAVPPLEVLAARASEGPARTRRSEMNRAPVISAAGGIARAGRVDGNGRQSNQPVAPGLASIPAREDRRAGLVQRLHAAVAAEDAEAVAEVWPELQGDPHISAIAILVADILQRRFGQVIAEALRRGDDETIVRSVQEAQDAGVAVTVSTRRAARAAARRIRLRERLAAAIEAGDPTTLVALARGPHLEEIQPIDRRTSDALARAERRMELDRALQAGDDAAIARAPGSGATLDDLRLDDATQARINLAVRRTEWLGLVRSALRSRDAKALDAALQDVPAGARDRLSQVERSRVERLIERERSVRRLHRALADGSDEAILDAVTTVMASGAPLPELIDWEEVQGVIDRISLYEAVREAASTSPPDDSRLARLLPAARLVSREFPALAGDLDIDELERRVLRASHLTRVLDALAGGNDEAIVAAALPDAFGAMGSLNAQQRARVEAAVSRVGRR
ncbi:MAG TPA: hypothetical protein VGR16_08760 [Thermomicrobiales bacterium]|nr:hypothetical protein [Thermomicrobiales bacterium]